MAKLSKKIDSNKADLGTDKELEMDDSKIEETIRKRKKQFRIILIAVFVVFVVVSFIYFSNRKDSDISDGKIYGKDVSKYVKLGNYKNVTYTAKDTSVSDEEVEKRFQTLIENKTTFSQLPDREGTKVNEGDLVNCSYKAVFDGEVIEEGQDKFEIGAGIFPEFEKALVGQTIGQSVNVSARIPENYDGKLTQCKGKVVTFDVKINFALEKNVPELDDEFAKAQSYGACEKASEFKDYLKNLIQTEKEDDAHEAISAEIMAEIIASSKFKNYKSAVDSHYKTLCETYKTMAETYNMTYEEYLDKFFGKNEEEFEKETKEVVDELIKEQLAMVEIARIEKLDVEKGSKKYKEYLPVYLKEYGCAIEEELFNKVEESYILESMTYDCVMEYLIEHAKAK